ncbi:sugar kinase [Halococcus hamelinensis]|uniref:PfkB domain-containing protein n=2 Tax=Halococcus hamelinensis TaxID=332168 RepID=M0M282_9EURY|nr:sugar kinase [Halococcus hamelinensis]EMA39937.1 PfkB domain-containing protein [Halococcus hamelinensis 100A6]
MADLLALGVSVLELTPPEHRRLETAERFAAGVAGPESNTTIAASRLGADAAWVSKLPGNPLGRRVAGALRRHGVETAVSWAETGRQGLAFTERAGDPRGGMTLHDRNAPVASMQPADLPATATERASMVLTSGATATLSETLTETTRTVFEECAAGETTTVCSLSRPRVVESGSVCEALSPLLAATDVLLTTEAGAAAFVDRATPTETAHALAAGHGFETVVLVRADLGAVVWHDNRVDDHDVPATDAVDDRGAFDALCGGFLARRIAGESPDRALAAGVACGALARTVAGPVPTVDPAAVERCADSMDGSTVE